MDTKAAVKWAMALLIGFGIIVLGFRFAGWLLTGFFILNCLVLRSRRCIRRRRQPDRFWPPRRGQRPLKSYHMVRHHVHALCDGARSANR